MAHRIGNEVAEQSELAGKLCDFLVRREIAKDCCYIAAELKARVQHVGDIVAQLQAGADILAGACPERGFIPVLVKRRGIGPQELRLLRQSKIRYRNQFHPIRLINDGEDLAAIGA